MCWCARAKAGTECVLLAVQLTQRAQNQDEEEVGWGSDDEKLASPRPEGQQEQHATAAAAAGVAPGGLIMVCGCRQIGL